MKTRAAWRRWAAAVILPAFCAASIGWLAASDRFFPNLRQVSPNGRYVAMAESPDNPGGVVTRPFQGDFVYRLQDTALGKLLWTRRPPPLDPKKPATDEGPPTALWVSDDGWTAVLTADLDAHSIELITLSREGKETFRTNVIAALESSTTGSPFEHTSVSSVGLLWGAAYSHARFLTVDGRPHFALRAWWDRCLLVDLTAGRAVPAEGAAMEVLAAAENAEVLRVLKGAQAWSWQPGSDGHPMLTEAAGQPSLGDGLRALHLAGRARMADAVPYLRALESCPYVGRTTGGFGDYRPGPDSVTPHAYEELQVRQFVRLALLRLGAVPSGYQSTKLLRQGDHYGFPQDPQVGDRDRQAEQVRTGMTPEAVLDLLGAPDFIDSGGWAYDLPGPAPCTLRISWGALGVKAVRRQTPPSWEGNERDRMLVL